jgi:MFS family permease
MFNDMQDPDAHPSTATRKFHAEELIFFAAIIFSLVGVAITDYAPTQSWVYWLFMIAALATSAIVIEKLLVPRKELPFSRLLGTQLIHWGATLIAVFISFTFVKTGRMTYEGIGLVVLLILSLATFLDGYHVGWRFYLTGTFLGITTVLAAYFEQFMWVMFIIAILSVVFAVYLEKYLTSRRESDPENKAAP